MNRGFDHRDVAPCRILQEVLDLGLRPSWVQQASYAPDPQPGVPVHFGQGLAPLVDDRADELVAVGLAVIDGDLWGVPAHLSRH